MRKIVLLLVIILIANPCYAQRRKRPIVTPIRANVTAETKAEISTRPPPPGSSTTKAPLVFKKLVTSSIALSTTSTTTRPMFKQYVPASDYRFEAIKTTTISVEEKTKETTTTAVPVTNRDLKVRVEEGQNSTVDVDLPSRVVEIGGTSNSSQNKGQISSRGKVELNLIKRNKVHSNI